MADFWVASPAQEVIKLKKVVIPVRLPQIKRILDITVDAKQTQQLLSPLGFNLEEKSPDTVHVSVPSFRQRDVAREIDVIEEVCRCWGYDCIEPSMPANTIPAEVLDDTEYSAKQALISCGLSETWISSLVGPEQVEEADSSKTISVLNPLSQITRF